MLNFTRESVYTNSRSSFSDLTSFFNIHSGSKNTFTRKKEREEREEREEEKLSPFNIFYDVFCKREKLKSEKKTFIFKRLKRRKEDKREKSNIGHHHT
jgi:hypothetical protein